MAQRKTSITIFKPNGKRESRGVPLWRDSFTQYHDGGQVRSAIDGLWAIASNQHKRGMAMITHQGPQTWQESLGLASNARTLQDNLKSCQRAASLAGDLLEQVHNERGPLRPFDADAPGNNSVTRASIRQAIAAMPVERRRAFLAGKIDNLTRHALFETAPEISGLDANDASYARLRAEAMQELHGPRLARLEALEGLADYALKLAAGVEEATHEEITCLGLKPTQARQFAQDALAPPAAA